MSLPDVETRNKAAWTRIWRGTTVRHELSTLDYPRSREEIAAYLPFLLKDRPVLEAGCGVGRVVIYLLQSGYDVVGVDYCADALEKAKTHAPGLPLVLADLRKLPFETGVYHAYLSFGVLEHFLEGPVNALAEANRVLEDGGILVVTVPHPNVFHKCSAPVGWLRMNGFVRRLFGKRPLRDVWPADSYYETSFNRSEIQRHLRDTGFEIIVQEPVGHAFSLWLLSRMFQKQGSYYDTNSVAETLARVLRQLAPWATCFMTLTVARKRAPAGVHADRQNRS